MGYMVGTAWSERERECVCELRFKSVVGKLETRVGERMEIQGLAEWEFSGWLG
jgi:hypothetical protein